MKRRSIHLSFH